MRILRPCIPTKIERQEDGKLKVTWHRKMGDFDLGTDSDVFDTVFIATGRKAFTKGLKLEDAGVLYDPKNGKIFGKNEQTNVENIFAIGDCLAGGVELTPVAIQAGRLLARRLFASGTEAMDYNNIATTVYTPIEYGMCGLSEEKAEETFGKNDLEIYHCFFDPLEYAVPHRASGKCYCKLICVKSLEERVVGIHYFGPNAGEVIQGFALGIKMHARKRDLDATIGIHPTSAETFTTMHITKSSGSDPKKTGC